MKTSKRDIPFVPKNERVQMNEGVEETFKVGEIVRYIDFESDLKRFPHKKPLFGKYFKIKKEDIIYDINIINGEFIDNLKIRKTNFFEKFLYWWLWKF